MANKGCLLTIIFTASVVGISHAQGCNGCSVVITEQQLVTNHRESCSYHTGDCVEVWKKACFKCSPGYVSNTGRNFNCVQVGDVIDVTRITECTEGCWIPRNALGLANIDFSSLTSPMNTGETVTVPCVSGKALDNCQINQVITCELGGSVDFKPCNNIAPCCLLDDLPFDSTHTIPITTGILSIGWTLEVSCKIGYHFLDCTTKQIIECVDTDGDGVGDLSEVLPCKCRGYVDHLNPGCTDCICYPTAEPS